MILSTIAIPCLLHEAYEWLCTARKKHPANADVWDFRCNWHRWAQSLLADFRTGDYRFDVQKKITLASGETIALWSARDALVIKVLTWIIQEAIQPLLSRTCYHVKGHGGLKGAVREVLDNYPHYRFLCKTDVKSYYDSIDHLTLMLKLHDCIGDRTIIGYVWQFLNRCVEWGGLYQDIKRGIPRGASLSPLLGAFYLLDLDRRMERLDVRYFRYMDDILILAPTRWKLKRAIRVLNETFNELKLEKHPDKTSMGRIEKGFDVLGYHFSPQGLLLAQKTIDNFVEKALRLYEQEPPHLSMKRLGEYSHRWVGWAYGHACAGGSESPHFSLEGESPPQKKGSSGKCVLLVAK
jgi:RNA-directed DNA polymerase